MRAVRKDFYSRPSLRGVQKNASLTFRQCGDFAFDFALKNNAQVRMTTEASFEVDWGHTCGIWFQKRVVMIKLKLPCQFGKNTPFNFSNINIVDLAEFAMAAIRQVLPGDIHAQGFAELGAEINIETDVAIYVACG